MPSYVNVSPKALVDAAEEIEEIVDDLVGAGETAMPYLRSIIPAGADETSAVIAAIFADQYREMQDSLNQWNSFMDSMVSRNLRVASEAYTATEAVAKYELDIVEDNVEAFFKSPVKYVQEKMVEIACALPRGK